MFPLSGKTRSFTANVDGLIQGGSFVCNETFLSSLSPDWIIPSTVPRFSQWKYEGNGTDIEKFFAIVEKNANRLKAVIIDCGTEFIPITTAVSSQVIEVVYVWTEQLTEQSQRNLRDFLLPLLCRLPKLRWFGIGPGGNPNLILEDVWNNVPESVTHIGVYNVPLTQRGINVIADKMKHHI